MSGTSITFSDTGVSIQNNKLVTKIYRKSTDGQNFLDINSKYPVPLKDSIHCKDSICTTPNDFSHFYEKLKQLFVNQGYEPQLINKHKSRKQTGPKRTFKR